MAIIFVSGVPFGGGKILARRLSEKLGYDYLDREEVVAKANESAIPVGKLEVAMVKKPAQKERLATLRNRYLAVATAAICEKAAEGNLVYFGRAGHLLLQGVSHVVRVRVVPNKNLRLKNAMERLRLDREKAQGFIDGVDKDIGTWVRFVHACEMDDFGLYDFVVNLENLSLENASIAVCTMAELPDFRPTPASRKAMKDKLLQSRARIRLALDKHTANADLTVRSREQIVTVTYLPGQAELAPMIPGILRELPGCAEIRCTMAGTNILWVQEHFDASSVEFREVSELARRWGAAVELVRFKAGEEQGLKEISNPLSDAMKIEGGIEEDVERQAPPEEEASFNEALDVLVQAGCSGGGHYIAGDREHLFSSLHATIPYSLVIIGNVHMDKPVAARTRLVRELTQFLGHRLKTPAITTGELKQKLRFGKKEVFSIAAAAVTVAILYWICFTNQQELLNVLGGPIHGSHRWIAPILVVLVVPIVASLYGKLAGSLLKLVKLN